MRLMSVFLHSMIVFIFFILSIYLLIVVLLEHDGLTEIVVS